MLLHKSSSACLGDLGVAQSSPSCRSASGYHATVSPFGAVSVQTSCAVSAQWGAWGKSNLDSGAVQPEPAGACRHRVKYKQTILFLFVGGWIADWLEQEFQEGERVFS